MAPRLARGLVPVARLPGPRLCLGCVVGLIVALGPAATAEAAKTDLVVLQNGDQITCEVTILERGKLQVKTDAMGTVDVEWDKVRALTASGLFEVEDLQGRLYLGSLRPGAAEGQIEVVGSAGSTTLELLSVVRIQQLEIGFWRRLSGSLDLGFGYTSSSDLTQFNLHGRLTFRRPSFQVQMDADSIVTRQPGTEDTQRGSVGLGYRRFRGNRQIFFGLVSAEQNRELGFDLRTGVRGGWGRYLVRGQGNELMAAVGLSLNREDPVEGTATANVEGVIALDWARFAYSTPKTDVEIHVLVFPSLSSWGRWRLELDANVRREIFKDFFVSLKGYDSFDSDPATLGASRNDWGLTFGVGYSFS
jgi:hypothetical protein